MKYLKKYAKRMFIFLLVAVIVSSSFAAVGMFNPAKVRACGDEGLTPGFWKNHTDLWPVGLTPNNLVWHVFDEADAYEAGDATLLEALKFKGGKGLEGAVRILLRAGVAAALNSAAPDSFVNYPRYLGEVQDMVNEALASGDRDTMIDVAEQLDEWNNLGVPWDD